MFIVAQRDTGGDFVTIDERPILVVT